MKTKIKKLTKTGILLLVISLFLLSCNEKDEIIEVDNSLTVKKISFNQIKEDKLILEKVSKYSSTKTAQRNSENDDLLNFVVLTDSLKYVQQGNYHSYSFPIYRENYNENIQENLLVNLEPDGTYKDFLVRYYLTKEEFNQLDENPEILDNAQIEIIPLENSIMDNNLSSRCSISYTMVYTTTWNSDCSCQFVTVSMEDISFSNECYSNNNSGGGGSSGGSGGGSTPIIPDNTITSPINIDGTSAVPNFLINVLGNLSDKQISWVNNPNNFNQVSNLLNIVSENGTSDEVKILIPQIIDILKNNALSESEKLSQIINLLNSFDPEISSTQMTDYKAEVLRMTAWLKVRGNREFGEFIESLVPNFNTMTLGEVISIYEATRAQYLSLKGQYMMAIISPFLDAVYPFIEFAVIEATLGAAIPILAKIPAVLVTRGAKLEAMVRKVGLLGVQGTSNSIRIVTAVSPYAKAESLFSMLTKNAISTTTQTNGAILANMGNGNYIIFRPITASSSGFVATISLDFRAAGIWSQIRNVKFK